MSDLSIHLLSDLHLEISKTFPTYLSKIKADILVLAGDIGKPHTDKYSNFIEYCSNLFSHVIVIAGNHEYYSKTQTMYDIDNKIREIASNYNNVHFLQQDFIIINNIRFVGCTLWSLASKYGNKTNDFDNIKGMTFALYNQLFMSNRKYLDKMLKDRTYKTVVITHHVPSYELINSKFKGDNSNSFYASHLDDLVGKADMWLCGHTHSSMNITINGCQCVINAHGYPGESYKETGFNKDLLIQM